MTDVFPFSEEQFVIVGKIAKPHGLRGEVKLYAYSDEPETLLQYSRVVLVDANGRLSPVKQVEKSRLQGKVAVIKLKGVDNRDNAEAIHNMGVLIDKKDLPIAGDDEFYWYQLYNLPVYTENGLPLGSVKNIFSNGAQDIMVVKSSKQEYLIPVLDTIIKEHSKERIIIDPPPGLLEINTGINE